MPKSNQEPAEEQVKSNRMQRIEYLTSRVEELETQDGEGNQKEISEHVAEIDRLEALSDDEFEEEIMEEEFEEEEGDTGGVEVTPTTSSPTEAPKVEAEADAPKTQEVDPETGKPLSAYKKRLKDLGRDALGAEIPLELADMMRAAAKAAGDIALTAWVRLAWADAVNAAKLTHMVEVNHDGIVTQEEQPWTFDKKTLDITIARQSTRGLTDEQKAQKAAEKKAADQDQRSLVKWLLVEHKIKTGAPLNAAELEVFKAQPDSPYKTELAGKMKLQS